MLAEFDRYMAGADAGSVTSNVLDAIAWMLFRKDRRTEAIQILRKNIATFPDEYVRMESLAFAMIETGEEAAAMRMLEDWQAKHPDNDLARWQLINLRSYR